MIMGDYPFLPMAIPEHLGAGHQENPAALNDQLHQRDYDLAYEFANRQEPDRPDTSAAQGQWITIFPFILPCPKPQ